MLHDPHSILHLCGAAYKCSCSEYACATVNTHTSNRDEERKREGQPREGETVKEEHFSISVPKSRLRFSVQWMPRS